MRVGDDHYWRCLMGMNHMAERMSEKGYGDPKNGNRFWCAECKDWTMAQFPESDKAICCTCSFQVFTPNQVKAQGKEEVDEEVQGVRG